MKILIHACCGPCLVYPYSQLKEHDCHVFFTNSNIHPYTEYIKRRDACRDFCTAENIPFMEDSEYNMETFFQNVAYREHERCRFCYLIRLEEACRRAKSGKFDAVTTTLLYSKFQKHELIRSIGESMAQKYNIQFLYSDFRQGWKSGIEESKSRGMYRQQYCGCIYSEKERYYRK